ncbi:hypothetical protein C8Q70DRAFT_691095 [Cubamyces menziesii]|nr:hypothetical protein C8Q70DRAFT_691095 [Cubamyces menziesii]
MRQRPMSSVLARLFSVNGPYSEGTSPFSHLDTILLSAPLLQPTYEHTPSAPRQRLSVLPAGISSPLRSPTAPSDSLPRPQRCPSHPIPGFLYQLIQPRSASDSPLSLALPSVISLRLPPLDARMTTHAPATRPPSHALLESALIDLRPFARMTLISPPSLNVASPATLLLPTSSHPLAHFTPSARVSPVWASASALASTLLRPSAAHPLRQKSRSS